MLIINFDLYFWYLLKHKKDKLKSNKIEYIIVLCINNLLKAIKFTLIYYFY